MWTVTIKWLIKNIRTAFYSFTTACAASVSYVFVSFSSQILGFNFLCIVTFLLGETFKGLRLLRTFVGVLPCPPGKKNSYARHFKGKHGELYIVGKLNKCRFQKQIWIASFLTPTKEIAKMAAKMTILCWSILTD